MNVFKYLSILFLLITIKIRAEDLNSAPIIGILTQEVSRLIEREYPDKYFSYIAASYVKFVEGAAARVVPLWIGQPYSYYKDVMKKINGVLLPGGATFFNQSGGYADAGKYIYDIAVEMNDEGIYFPVWGTCLGFELLVYLTANGKDPRTECYSQSQAVPLQFVEGFNASRLFGNAGDEIITTFATYPVSVNFHMYCFTLETFRNMGLDQIWDVLSVNQDWNGIEFISSIEHNTYPFYGVQFHPEKNLYEFVKNKNITHTPESTKTSQYLATFFVNEARKNNQKFINATEELSSLIYNYKPEYTGAKRSAFAQQYLFPNQRSFAVSTYQNIFFPLTAIVLLLVKVFASQF